MQGLRYSWPRETCDVLIPEDAGVVALLLPTLQVIYVATSPGYPTWAGMKYVTVLRATNLTTVHVHEYSSLRLGVHSYFGLCMYMSEISEFGRYKNWIQ